MTTRKQLVARIAALSGSIAVTGQMEPKELVMETDLTLPQIRVLYMLASGPARVTDISQAQGMAPPNASSMVERLVRKGMVQRASDPNDRRVALACLTRKGQETVEAVNRSNHSAIEMISEFLSIEELEIVARALEVLDGAVKRLEATTQATVMSGCR